MGSSKIKIQKRKEESARHPSQVIKRDGRKVPFDQYRITKAVWKAMKACGEGDLTKDPEQISAKVAQELVKRFPVNHIPHIEEIQDIVEETLILKDFAKTAKSYIVYRLKRSEVREKQRQVPERIHRLVEESKKYFRNTLAEFVYYRTYSRWIEEEGRRETWVESVDRYMDFMKENIGEKLTDEEYHETREAILWQKVMPSMRLLWGAGKAARKTNVCAYNCSYIATTRLEDFAEIMYLSMCGAGVGFSAESHAVQRLPIVERQTGRHEGVHAIEDTKEGWGDALTKGLRTWFGGHDIEFDYGKLRPAGARLGTMGGRSSGPDPLRGLLDFARAKILTRQGKRLRNIDVHDIVCKIGEIAVAGGVRRTALISLSDLDDDEMRDAKKGEFFRTDPQRSMANNSAVYNEKPSAGDFLSEWLALVESGTGERGIFNRGGLKRQLPKRRWKLFKKHLQYAGTNPCGEIVLRSKQFCNLSEIVARADDTKETLLEKARVAAILGTYQSTLTKFPYLSAAWKRNCEEERLLGVSITGQWDCPLTQKPEILEAIREKVLETNRLYAKKLGINPSTCTTCVKPSGTVSQLVDAASGMHPRRAKYYIRRIRISATDPLFHMLRDLKFPHHPEVGQSRENATTYVLEFPVKAPKGAITRDDINALAQLEHWKMVKEHYTEHNPSVTVSVGENEWVGVANWLYDRWDEIGGLSFLPREKHVYQLAPYEEINEATYSKLKAELPELDFSKIVIYEKEDNTQGAKELACVGGVCEVDVDEKILKKKEAKVAQ
ncbi:MAG: ATP cone domain-containing protein [bacterium]|nr:ATP cone domain-containing protein [bacterium]